MYSPSQPELKREFKAAGTFSPPPDPGTMVAPPPSTGGHGFMHQRQSSFGGMGTPQPTRASIGGYNDPMHPTSQPPPQHQQHHQQQQQQQQPPPPSWLNSHPYPSPHIVSPSNSTPHPTSIPSTKTSTSTASSNASAPHVNDFVNDDDETQQRQ
ncbi:hypothetical protein BC940DRAFT_323607 [Gongronella butleri]|nr:hypothetical protein BC940DRAFT_323607 [Gongronella butleri]